MSDWNPSPEQRLCRDLTHAWQPSTAFRNGAEYIRELRCIRCSTVKVQTLSLHGYILRSEYRYAAGYVRSSGGRLTREDRAELRTANLADWGDSHA